MSVIFSLSCLKMAGFEDDNQVKSLIFQSTEEMPLVKMRGQSVSGDITFPRYFPLFLAILATF